jgi:CBS domain-containing protein
MVELSSVPQEAPSLTARDVLRQKGSNVITVRPEQGVLEVARVLAEHSVGSLLVVDDERNIVGILSERDVTRAMARDLDALRELKVFELMTRDVIIALESDTLDSVMALMTTERIRHVPIVSDGRLAGILSIGDIVKAKAAHAEGVVRHLTDYITGKYPN